MIEVVSAHLRTIDSLLPMRIRALPTAGAALAGTVAVLLAACSPSLEQPSDQPPGSEPDMEISAPASSAPADHQQASDDECTLDEFDVEGDSGVEPTIVVPEDCQPPTSVQAEDLDEGEGAEVVEGDSVEINYVAVGLSSGQQDSSWTSDTASEPVSIDSVGAGEVAPEWDNALLGMREGGRKLIVLPPEQGTAAEADHELDFESDEPIAMVIGLSSIG